MQSTDAVAVAVLDQFEPELYACLADALPPAWACTHARSYAEPDQLAAVPGAEVLFAGWAPVTSQLLAAAPRLKFIQKLGVGVGRVDLDICPARGIGVARLAGVNAVPVAEHALMLMLAALRQLPTTDRRMRAGEWFKEEARGFQRELRGRIVGLLGMGYVGRALAQRLRGFEVDLRYYDVRRLPPELEAELGLRWLTLDELISASDIVSLHVPLLPETRHIIDAARLRQMQPTAILINCARGELVDERALVDALRTGRLAAAALDTFASEPLDNAALLALDNVVLTPHSAGATADNFAFVARRAVLNARVYLAGQALPADDLVLAPGNVA